jgi:hypothetical protein
MRRVYGPDLMLAVCALAAERGWSSYLTAAVQARPSSSQSD